MAGFSYISCFRTFVDQIHNATVGIISSNPTKMYDLVYFEIEKLKEQMERVSRIAKNEEEQGKIIEDQVLKWQKAGDEIRKSAQEFLDLYKIRTSWRCIPLLPIPNPVSRSRLEEPKVDTHEFVKFPSRQDAYRKLREELTTEGNSSIIGIYGMPGVGKTRTAEQIGVEVLENNIFSKVARAYAGIEELNVITLQTQIASYLGLYFESKDSVEHRASQLKHSLMNRGKILIILDDVWRDIPFGIVGILVGEGSTSKGCKILLISRDEYVCLRNNCKPCVKIDTLAANEAWDMFRISFDIVHELDNEARDVCAKCAGLPLAIRTVVKALKYKTYNEWMDTLHNLRNSNIEGFGENSGLIYLSFKMSFDDLVEDAVSCLFLCSLYPEDTDIPIRTLIHLATGSQIIQDGRTRVLALVDILKSSSLLLEGKDDEHVKLHAVSRLVARSIAKKDPTYAFVFETCGPGFHFIGDYYPTKLLHLDLDEKCTKMSHITN